MQLAKLMVTLCWGITLHKRTSSDLSQVRADSETPWISLIVPLKARIGQCPMICSIVWDGWPQSHAGESFIPHLKSISPHLPCPVRILFNLTHVRRLSEKPGTREHGSFISWWLSGFDKLQFFFHSFSPLNWFSIRSFAVRQTGFLDLSLKVPFIGKSLWIGSLSFCVYLFHSLAVAVKRRVWGGCMLLNTGSHWVGVVFNTPVIMRMVEFSCTSILEQWALFSHTGAAYSAAE